MWASIIDVKHKWDTPKKLLLADRSRSGLISSSALALWNVDSTSMKSNVAVDSTSIVLESVAKGVVVESVAEDAFTATGSSIEARELVWWIRSPWMSHCEMLNNVDVLDAAVRTEEGGLISSISIIWKSSILSQGSPFRLRFLGMLLQTERDERNKSWTAVVLTGLTGMKANLSKSCLLITCNLLSWTLLKVCKQY